MRILCVIPTMGPGGAERVMSYLVTHFAKRHDVTLLTFENASAASFYPLPASVDYRKTDSIRRSFAERVWRIAARPGAIRKAVKALAPDVVVSFTDTTNMITLLACGGLGIPVVVSERIDPSEHRIGWLRTLLRAHTYARARLLVVPSRRVAAYFPAALQSRIRVIGNPIQATTVTANTGLGSGRKRVIAVGRYEPQKGFDLLIEAFARIAATHPDWDLAIVGEGPQRSNLEAHIGRLGLGKRVSLVGIVPDISRELAGSHIFACSSRYEGFPNALGEALAAGLPAVGYKDVSGVEDLIVDGRTGLLVERREGAEGLARALSRLVSDPELRTKAAKAARDHIRRWTPDHIFSLWDATLSEATGRPRS
jgi:glycosyltransferase involved in cell wall biosynthesis